MKKGNLAYVSPLPPVPSGVSYYSKELLPYLSEYYNITLVVDQVSVDEELLKDFEVIDIDSFRKSFKDYERVLYHFGNSEYHKHMFELLEEIPGVVVLHDVYISDLVNWMHQTGYMNNILYQELFKEEGIKGLLRFKECGFDEVWKKYQLNYSVINNSIGLIVHNFYTIEELKKLYFFIRSNSIKVIPQLRSVKRINRVLDKDNFYVGTFGYLTPLKMNHFIVEAFGKSKLSKISNTKLVFIGDVFDPTYREGLKDLIKHYDLKDKTIITGFVDSKEYERWLSLCDIAIQLRTRSRGESSRTVLDCLSAGIPTIVNQHGSFKELPDDVVYKIDEYFSVDELVKALEYLYDNESLRKKLSHNSIKYVSEKHDPKRISKQYYDTIEEFYACNTQIKILSSRYLRAFSEEKIDKFSSLIIKNTKSIVEKRRILFDCSVISIMDSKTGIQRVVKAELTEALKLCPEDTVIEPIRLTDEGGYWHLRYAYNWALRHFDIDFLEPCDEPVFLRDGDVYYAPDFYQWGVPEAYKAGLYQYLKLKGVKIVFLVYDLLPIEFPQYFPSEMKEVHEKWCETILRISDKIICISKDVANKLKDFAKGRGLLREDLEITWLHLGFDFKTAKHSEGQSQKDIEVFETVKKRPYFLMVSTIEPRKGHEQVLKAFEILWKKGYEYNLVFAGKIGWMVEDLVKFMKNHPELNKRFFHLGHVSDDLLEKLYSNALATIVASEGEGFGLSIAESAYYKTPIIARDISVFREVGGDGAFFFRNTKEPKTLAEDIEKWLVLYKEGRHPKADSIKVMSWEEHTKKLLEILLD